MNPERYFQVAFDRLSITDLLTITRDHLSRVEVGNEDGKLDDLLTATSNVFTELGGSVSGEKTAFGIQKARVRSKDAHLERIYAEASRYAGKLHAEYSKDSPEYLEFFPSGVSEVRRARQEEVEALLNRIVSAGEAYERTDVSVWVDLRTKWLTLYEKATDGKAAKRGSSGDRADAVTDLRMQLTRNLLELGMLYLGKPEKAGQFFDLALIQGRSRSSAEAEDDASATVEPASSSEIGVGESRVMDGMQDVILETE